MRATQTVVAREAIIARWAGNKNTVRATRVDEQKTNKRRCEPHGQIKKRRRKNEQKTKKERTKDEERTNKRRRKNEQKTVRATRADKEKTKKRRCESHGQMNK